MVLALVMAVPAVVVSTAFVAVTEASAQGAIRDIRVVGNRRVEPETVRTYLKFSVGDAYDAGKADQSIRSLFGTGLFSDVRIERDGTAVVVTVVENPVINQVAFEGNSEVDTATLTGEVQLKPRSIYTRARVQADVQRILDVYRRQGRFAAAVDPKLIERDNGRVDLVFEIKEGGATKVKTINFVGNRAFSDSQLRDIITTTQTGWFDFLKGNSVYDPDRLALDRELLRQYYLKNGYADAVVKTAGAELDRDGSGFFITFVVEEGQIYNFGKVDIETALPAINTASLAGEVLTAQGTVFDLSAVDKTVERLTLVIAEQGYAFARVRPRTQKDGNGIAVTYVIDEGPRVYIERINITGNQRTLDYVIRREFRLAEGDAYNPLLVDRAKKRLQNLGFFKTVEVKRRPGVANDRVVLDVELVEQSTGDLSFGAGFSTSEGVIGDISLTERNLLGRGQFVRLKLAGSADRMQIDLSFTEPRFLDRNLAAGFDLFHKDLDLTKTQAYKHQKTGGTLRLGFPLAENLWAQTSYTLSRDEIYSVTAGASKAIQEAQGTFMTSSLGLSVAYDKRNHPTNPNRGYYIQGLTDFAGLGGDVQYVRVQGEARAYYPVTEKITLVGRGLAGHIQGWGGEDVKLLDLFYKGGETIRGFKRAGIGPRDSLTGDPLGGTTFWSATAELRFPFPFIPDELGMSGAIFADAGSLFGAGQGALDLRQTNCGGTKVVGQGICLSDSNAVRTSVGASLLWNSPLGPLRLDYAKALTKATGDVEQAIQFGASTKF